MGLWQIKCGKAFWQIFLSPRGQLRVADLPVLQGQIEQALCLMGIGRIEDAPYLSGHWRALIKPFDVALRVVLQVKLAALPRHPGKHSFTGCFESRMVITGDELDPTQAPLNQAIQKGPPMHLCL